MRVVLFGAGASFGSGDVYPKPPPLGADLFPVLRRLYATWREIPEALSNIFQKNFELGMADVIEKHGFAIAPLMREMAIFFSIFGISKGANNRYLKLVKAAATHRDIVWSSLNYECLLEIAGSQLGHAINYFKDPAANGSKELPVWKLHGSCNFRVTGLDATRGVQFGTGVIFGGGIEPIDPQKVREIYQGSTALYPAMALYAHKKPVSMSPAPIQEAQQRWAAHVRNSVRLVVVGVRPNPDDDHIWQPLAETPGEVAYVGSKELFDEWSAKYRAPRPSLHLGESWSLCESALAAYVTG